MAFIAINTIQYILPCQPRALHPCQYESDVGPCLVVPFAPFNLHTGLLIVTFQLTHNAKSIFLAADRSSILYMSKCQMLFVCLYFVNCLEVKLENCLITACCLLSAC